MNSTVKVDTILGTPTLSKTFLPIDPEFNEFWSPIALAIQRGRDHGIPPYYKSLNLCEARLGLTPDTKLTFDDIEQVVGVDARKLLEGIYQNPEDIDLLAGALVETPALGTVFGPTLSCLLSLQFANLRNSDRFWYENDIPPSSLTLDQLQAVRRVTLAGLLCTASGITKAQPKAFIREDPFL